MESRGFWKWADVCVSLMVLTALPILANGTTYTFVQTNWGGGISVTVPTHTSNRTGWTEYSATTTAVGVVNSGADLQIATSTTSLTQTNEGSTNTGFNLSGRTLDDTAVVGTGSGAGIRLASSTTFGDASVIDNSANNTGDYPAIDVDTNNAVHVAYDDDSANDVKYATNASGSWVTSTVDSLRNSFYTAMVLDSSDKAHISYGDSVLRYATNATSTSPWSVYVVDDVGTVGQMSDIVLDSDGYVHISYLDFTNLNLNHATNRSGSWVKTTIDSTGHMGRWSSMVIDSSDVLHVTYQDFSNGDLKYATSTAGSGTWGTAIIDNGASVGYYSSLAIDNDDNLYVSYYNAPGATGSIKYATKAAGSSTWSVEVAANRVSDPLYRVSLALDSNDKAHIVYYYTNNSDSDLRYLTNASGAWASSTLASVGTVGIHATIAVDAEDTKHIAYKDNSAGVQSPYYLTEAITYPATGTFTSGTINLGVGALGWGTLSWSETLNGGTITLKARSDADGDFSDATAWGSCANITNGAALSTGSCVNDDHQYIQYQATLSTPDTTTTPILNEVTVGYVTYVSGQILTSSVFNTESITTAIDSLSWIEEESLPTNASLVVGFRTASTSAGISSGGWYEFNSVTVNCSKTTDTVTCPASALPTAIKDVTNDQFFQYRVTLQTDDGAATPTFSEMSVNYVPDAGVGPTVNTADASSLTSTSATLNGTITGTGGTNVTVRGFVYGTDPTLVTVIATTTDSVGQPFGTGAFSHALTDLTCGTTYYVRAYATNTAGTGFGFDEAFTLSCDTSSGGGGSSGSFGGGGNVSAPGVPEETVASEEREFRLPVFNHTERDRRFDPAKNPSEPEVPDEEAPEREVRSEPAPPQPEPSKGSSRVLGVVARTVQLAASTTEQVAPVAVPLGVLAGVVTVAGVVVPVSAGIGAGYWLGHLLHILLSTLGLRRRQPWGTVYDSITKRPLDPAVVELVNELGLAVQTTYTDVEGRYGFLVVPGTYRLRVTKHDYQFPSQQLAGQKWEEVYGPVYLGDQVIVDDQMATLLYNIPLDPSNLDFAAVARQNLKRYRYYSEARQVLTVLSLWLYRAGFLLAGYTVVTDPAWQSIGVVALFAAIGLLHRAGFGPRSYGTIVEAATGNSLSYALVTVVDARSGEAIKRTVTDESGRYYALVPDGDYKVTVARREIDGSYSPAYTSDAFRIRRSVVHRNFSI